MGDTEHPAVTNFRRYLRIETVQPNPNYAEATEYLKGLANEVGLIFTTVETVKGKDMCILTHEGKDTQLSSLMLYSHIDVVPVFKEHWKVDPFSADKIDGNIYARGAQDMKCVGIQYIEAVRRLKQNGVSLLRTIHIIFGPDEEIGGVDGMKIFVKHEAFQKLNIGFVLDEGLANPGDEFRVFYGERSVWWVKITCTGPPGHGSSLIKDTAAEKFHNVISRFMKFRREQEQRLVDNPNLMLGEVTSVNLTIVQGGVQTNVVPSSMSANFDMRIPPTQNLIDFEQQLRNWCKEAGDGVTLDFQYKADSPHMTSIYSDDKWWSAFSSVFEKLQINLKTEIFPAATDSRYLRECGIPAIGFSPMNKTPILLHDHNEYLNEEIFLKGIEIYEELIPSLANVQ